jgi:hypothetical protein
LKSISIILDLQYTISNRCDSYRNETEKVFQKNFSAERKGVYIYGSRKKGREERQEGSKESR